MELLPVLEKKTDEVVSRSKKKKKKKMRKKENEDREGEKKKVLLELIILENAYFSGALVRTSIEMNYMVQSLFTQI